MLVHVITRKGFGYAPAEENEDDRCTRSARSTPARHGPAADRTWTQVFAEELVAIGAQRPDVVAITAAMLNPTGLARSRARSPTGSSTSASPSSTR